MSKKQLLLVALLINLTSCAPQPLSVFSTYITPESRASFFVKTPDPYQNCPEVGQRLYVNWHLSDDCLKMGPIELRLYLRFRNRQQIIESCVIGKASGTYVYSLLNQKYFETDGLATYKIELLQNDQILHEWHHLMWVELIQFND